MYTCRHTYTHIYIHPHPYIVCIHTCVKQKQNKGLFTMYGCIHE